MQHLVSQALERSAELFLEYDRLLILCPPDQDWPDFFDHATRIVTHNYRSYISLKNMSETKLYFGLDPLPDQYDAVLVYMPKAKGELELLLDYASSALASSGTVFLVGEKKSGIASGAKLLAAKADDCAKIDSAKHCQLWSASGVEQQDPFELARYFLQHDVRVGEHVIKIASLPGVFSAGRVDDGTTFLLQQEIKRLKNRTLDFGCGAGVIACALKTLNPEIDIEACDISWLALKSTEKSLSLNDLSGRVYASDGWSDVAGRVNGVVTNPPFHQGVATEYATTEQFITQARDKMARYAPLYIVANSFLKYPPVIESAFGACSVLNKNSQFVVYYSER